MVDILKKIQNFEAGPKIRMDKLYKYYVGEQAILKAVKADGKPNNKIVTNYAKNIVNNTTGYYLGVPIAYSTQDKGLQDSLTHITEYNDDAFHNTQIGRDVSIFGVGAELLYIDDDGEIRYGKTDPLKLYIGYSSDIERKIEYAIRWYDAVDDNDQLIRHIEYYTESTVDYYTYTGGTLTFVEAKEHLFGQVPINVFQNNEDCFGDYDDAIPLMDAYNVMQSESVNDFQKFADAILAVRNMVVDGDTTAQMRDAQILELMNDGEASWLVKQVNDAYVENVKNRLEKDIYMTTSTVNMSDDNFANNASGVAIRYKLMCMENRVSCTARYFKKALQRRFEMICNVLNFKGGNYNYLDIETAFVRNIPAHLQEIATSIQQLSGTVSKRTLLQQLPFIEDVDEELKQLQKESDFDIMSDDNMGDEDEQ